MAKKKAAIVCFTPGGSRLAGKIQDCLEHGGRETEWETESFFRPIPFGEWMQEHFRNLDALIFIGAMGIAVRGMAPFLKSKLTDPAVVVLDEKGQFVISVLSGHLGGANELAKHLAELLDAVPVITTASDVSGKVAIDVFAQKNGLEISSMECAKECAACIVTGQPVSFSCEGDILGKIPAELSAKPEEAGFRVIVSPDRLKPAEHMLQLIPKAYVLGIGCKRGISSKQLEARVEEELLKNNIDPRSILAAASIDLKKDEEGLLDFFGKLRIPLYFYSAEELSALEGNYTSSEFVAKTTGVDNVCERAGFLLARQQGMRSLEQCRVLPKSAKDGVTVSIMKIDWSVCFE
ncbi:MAG: cobalt-precorrin 5A hydrolase [Lachnospiraceae bacterium]